MLQQAIDFREECDSLFSLLKSLDEQDWQRKTQFKEWTISDIIGHLHFGDYAADVSLRDSGAFKDFARQTAEASKGGRTHVDVMREWIANCQGNDLLNCWRSFALEMAGHFAGADPKLRVLWFGPDMSVRSSITARLMETWAHAQAIYDLLGKERQNADRIKNIVVIGMNTFGWTFTNRKLPVPTDQPYVRLTAPSGEIWEWNQPNQVNSIEGKAEEFCQVVTQARNIVDTKLRVTGATATSWMSMAQCFAGPPETPPGPGTRFRQR